jgi:NAD(P)H-hydrate epimerase
VSLPPGTAASWCLRATDDHRRPDGTLWRNATGNAGLARGGSGDLQAGVIASLAAQGVEPAKAAACGVFLHGMAADRCAARLSQYGMLPSDLPAELCAIFLAHGR